MTNEKRSNGKNESGIKNLVAERLMAKMCDLRNEIKDRHQIEKECLDSLKQESRATTIILNELMKWTLGSDPIIEKRRLDLEERLCRVRREVRDHKVRTWNDIQRLKQEIRDLKDLYNAVRESSRIKSANSSGNGNGNS